MNISVTISAGIDLDGALDCFSQRNLCVLGASAVRAFEIHSTVEAPSTQRLR
jgi:hypothetical protein